MLFENIFLVSDLDGTLLNSKSILDDKNAVALNYFMANGGLFAPASGRSKSEMLAVLKDKVTPNMPVICLNGAAVCHACEDKPFYVKTMGENARSLARQVRENLDFVAVECYAYDREYIINPNESTDVHNAIIEFHPTVLQKADELPDDIVKVALWCNPDYMDKLLDFLKNDLKDVSVTCARSHLWCVDIHLEGVSKGTTFDMFRNLYKDIKTIISVGDHENDISMMKMADYSFAVATATDNTKKTAKEVLASGNDDNAIAEVVEKIKKMVKQGLL